MKPGSAMNWDLAEPVFLRNLMIFPVTGRNGGGQDLAVKTIDEILKANQGSFRELETPVVDEIIFHNQGMDPALMLDGEEITGAMQNRILARSEFIEPKMEKPVRVVCVEEKRWDEIGGFKTGACSYPTIRSILIQGAKSPVETQRKIWTEIERKLTVTKTISKTSSMHDVYENLNDEIERYLEDFSSLNGRTIGFIGATNDRILGCDIFATPGIYQKFENKLVRSYALDALEYRKNTGVAPEAKLFFKKVLASADSSSRSRTGRRKKVERDFVAQILVHRNNILHLSAFPS